MNELYKALKDFLESKGITTVKDHTSSCDEILAITGTELTLGISVEVYDHTDGSHETVRIEELVETITTWSDNN